MTEPQTITIQPQIEVQELRQLVAFLTNRNLILAQALEDALKALKTAEETIAQRDAEIAKMDAARAPTTTET